MNGRNLMKSFKKPRSLLLHPSSFSEGCLNDEIKKKEKKKVTTGRDQSGECVNLHNVKS